MAVRKLTAVRKLAEVDCCAEVDGCVEVDGCAEMLCLSGIPCVLIDLTHLPICVIFSVCWKCWRERDFVVSFFALLASPAAILVVVCCCNFLENADRWLDAGPRIIFQTEFVNVEFSDAKR